MEAPAAARGASEPGVSAREVESPGDRERGRSWPRIRSSPKTVPRTLDKTLGKKKMSTAEIALFSLEEARKDHEDAIYEDFTSDAAKKRFKLSVAMGPVYQSRLRIGRLKILLIESANLPAADLGGKSDPYAKLILTGRNKYGDEWLPERRATIRSATVKKDLNPRWHETHEVSVPRHDTVLRVEVYDEDASSADDLLGWCEIPVRDLSFLGLVKRWFPLEVAEGFTAASAAVHLHLEYDVSALGEAASMLWAEQPKAKDATKFDVNLMYRCRSFCLFRPLSRSDPSHSG